MPPVCRSRWGPAAHQPRTRTAAAQLHLNLPSWLRAAEQNFRMSSVRSFTGSSIWRSRFAAALGSGLVKQHLHRSMHFVPASANFIRFATADEQALHLVLCACT